jgi:serine/threonine protein kinase
MDFKFVKFLGQGTFGDVYLAVHKKTNSLFTIKRYRKDTIK